LRDKERGLTAEWLRRLLDYDPETGHFYWKVMIGDRSPVGKRAGGERNGYWRIKIDGIYYRASRLAFLIVHGYWPSELVDHINRNRLDDRIVNLREASPAQNLVNSKLRKDNSTGYKGVQFSKKNGKYQALGHRNGKPVHLGFFDDPEKASAAYIGFSRGVYGDYHHIGDPSV
jgi:hypothetical protein